MKHAFLLTLTFLLALCVRAQDETPPVAVCQDITVYINDEGFAPITPEDIDGGSYDDESGIDYMELSEYELWCDYTWEEYAIVTLYVYDMEGNSSECEAQVVVIDDMPPSFVECMDIEIELNAQGYAAIEAWELSAGDNDNCGVEEIVASITEFSCEHIGDNVVTVSFYDASGNFSDCEAIVSVSDPTPAVAVCLYGGITVYLEHGAASIGLNEINDGYAACRISSSVLSQSDFTCEDIGVVEVTLTVTDWDGIETNCTTEVYVDEDEPVLEAVCQNITVGLIEGAASISFEDIDGGSLSSCGFDVEISQTEFSDGDVGENIVTLTLTGASGNESSCEALVTIEAGEELDITPPVALCQDITLNLYDEDGFVEIFPEDVDNGSFDEESGIASVELSAVEFWCDNIWTENIVTLTVTDNAGNVAECEAAVTILDVTAPRDVECYGITIELDDAGYASIEGWDIVWSVNDNCGVEEVEASQTEFFCENLGDNLIQVVMYDASGNTAACEVTVTVEEPKEAVAKCLYGGLTIYLDGGQASISPGVLNDDYSSCLIATSELSQSEFTCDDYGMVEVVLTVTDLDGNTSSCSTEIYVEASEESEGPTAVCQDITIELVDGVATIAPEDIDGGSFTDNCVIYFAASQTEFTADHVGENNVTLTVSDPGWITASCVAIVTVELGVTEPVAVCADITVALDAGGNVEIEAAAVDGGSTDEQGITDFEISQSIFDCNHVGENVVTLTVSNAYDLSAACEAIVTIVDQTPPTALCQPITVSLDENGMVEITEEDIDAGSYDACGILSVALNVSSFGCEQIGNMTVQLDVTDVNGNTSTCKTTVTVEDNTEPTAICAEGVILSLVDGEAYLVAEDFDGGSFDNCGIASVEISHDLFTCENIGENLVELTVTDDNGLQTVCEAVVTVQGSIPSVYIEKNSLPSFCQGTLVELEAFSADAVVYVWDSPDDERNIISNGDIPRSVMVGESGLYNVRVANKYGCVAEASYELELDITALTSSYTILANSVSMKRNTVGSGGIGILNAGGKAKFESSTSIVDDGTFVKSPKFEIKSGSTVNTQYAGVASVEMPGMISNPYSTGKSDDLKVPGNAVVTINGSIFNNIEIGRNAKVTFTSPMIFARDIVVKEGGEVSFAACTRIVLSNRMILEKNTVTNSDNQKLIVFNDISKNSNQFEITGYNVTFNGSLFMPNANMKTAKAKADKPIYLSGQFIVNELSADEHAIWNVNNNCDPACNTVAPEATARINNAIAATPSSVIDNEDAFGKEIVLTAAPNPFTHATAIRFVVPQDGKVKVSLYSVTGQEVSSLYNGYAEAGREYNVRLQSDNLGSGIYLYRLETEHGHVSVNKLVLTK